MRSSEDRSPVSVSIRGYFVGRLAQIDRPLKVLVVTAFILLVVLQVWSFWRSDPSRLVTAVVDDAYFYFEIARNFVHSGNFTFDGRTLTNGFHPLWMAVLVPIFLLVSDPILVLRIIGSLGTLLLGIAGYVSLRYVGSRFPLVSFCISALLMMKFYGVLMDCSMETSILIPLCVAALIIMTKIDLRALDSANPKHVLGLGLVLSLVQLARLDAVLLNGTVLILTIVMNRKIALSTRFFRKFAALAVPSLVTGSGFLIVNYAVFGNIVPVSGITKSVGNLALNRKMLAQLTDLRSISSLTSIWLILLVLTILSAVYLGVFSRKRGWKFSGIDLSRESYVAAMVSIFCISYLGFYLIASSWRLWEWYFYPALLCGIFVVPLLGAAAEQCGSCSNLGRRVFPPAKLIIGILTIVIMFATAVKWGIWTNKQVNGNFQYQNYQLAMTLNGELEGRPLAAMGDRAGSFAYFFKGDVLQLEGLVGDYELLRAIKQNTLADYMTLHGVKYVIAYISPPKDYQRWQMLVPFPEFSSGPHAEVFLCRETELLRRETPAGTIFVWKWPSCVPQECQGGRG